MKLGGIDLDAADFVVGNLAGIDLVIQVVLATDVYGASLELEVYVLSDENDFLLVVFLVEQEACGEDAVIDPLTVGENAVEFFELFEAVLAGLRIVDDEADCSSAFGCDAFGGGFTGIENFRQAAVDAAGIGAALGLLAFEFIQLGKDIYEDADVVVLEALNTGGVM